MLNDVCLTREGCFHIHCSKCEFPLSLLKENLIERGGATSMICDTTNSLEAKVLAILMRKKKKVPYFSAKC